MSGGSAVVVGAWPGQPSATELERRAAAGEAPRKDYVEIARALGADIIDAEHMHVRACTPARLVARYAGMENGEVAEVVGRRYRNVLAWGDPLGLKIAAVPSRRRLVMISHRLTNPRRTAALRRLHRRIDTIVPYSSLQIDLGVGLGINRERFVHGLQPVDQRFWRANGTPAEDMICSVGSEARDFRTLIDAVEGLPVRAELAVGTMVLGGDNPRGPQIGADELPPNVTLERRLTPVELRSLYARARIVVIPLFDGDFDPGVTAITEAMAMGKPVVVTRTRGQRDVVVDGQNGLYVPPRDTRALRDAITTLLDDPQRADEMGRAGREAAVGRHSLDDYVRRVADIVRG